MKTFQTAIGLAYSVLVLQDLSLAREVRALEERLDAMKVSLQTWVLRLPMMSIPQNWCGLLHLAEAGKTLVIRRFKCLSCA